MGKENLSTIGANINTHNSQICIGVHQLILDIDDMGTINTSRGCADTPARQCRKTKREVDTEQFMRCARMLMR